MGSTYAATDWPRIVGLYHLLRKLASSLVVDVNRAFAVAMQSGARAELDELDAIPDREILRCYPYVLAVYADLHITG
jgi:RNA polymerase sigma-70 factor (ECF subfamily)